MTDIFDYSLDDGNRKCNLYLLISNYSEQPLFKGELRKESDFLKKQRHSLRRKSIRGSSISFRNTTIIGGSDDFNTLKNDLIYQHYYRTEKELYTAIKEFAYVQYNHVHPHSYNDYKTPYETRYGVV